MTLIKDLTQARRTLIAAGIRTLGFGFDGSGDDGSLQDMCFPENPSMALDDCGSPGEFTPAYSYVGGSPAGDKALQLKKQVESLVDEGVLRDMAYSALEFFPGDWVNNDGGYGVVALDLLTGEFNIDGYERYMEVHSVDQTGTVGVALDASDVPTSLDVTSVLRSTLGLPA